MAKRKYKSDKFQVRRINRQWWVLEKDLETNCYSKHEQKHVVDAYTFELSKVQRKHIRERQVQQILANIDLDLARQV
ncbi:catalase-related domain-containing protein, partial [Acinetobacter baumannii]|uniref:catalase-related domain-containing protein n=1 Tax=Acinetobacter baumannii TaxID=470 RepID=UPI001D18DED0